MDWIIHFNTENDDSPLKSEKQNKLITDKHHQSFSKIKKTALTLVVRGLAL